MVRAIAAHGIKLIGEGRAPADQMLLSLPLHTLKDNGFSPIVKPQRTFIPVALAQTTNEE